MVLGGADYVAQEARVWFWLVFGSEMGRVSLESDSCLQSCRFMVPSYLGPLESIPYEEKRSECSASWMRRAATASSVRSDGSAIKSDKTVSNYIRCIGEKEPREKKKIIDIQTFDTNQQLMTNGGQTHHILDGGQASWGPFCGAVLLHATATLNLKQFFVNKRRLSRST